MKNLNAMNIWVGKPTELNDSHVVAVAKLILSGGAIIADTRQLRTRLMRSSTLAICFDEDKLIAVGCLKVPTANYRATVFEKAGVKLLRFQTAPELGYIAVDQVARGRGLSGRIVAALSEHLKEPCFATTDNPRMKRGLQNAGFSEQGKHWVGDRGTLSLWIKE